jgi:hypothetical protein
MLSIRIALNIFFKLVMFGVFFLMRRYLDYKYVVDICLMYIHLNQFYKTSKCLPNIIPSFLLLYLSYVLLQLMPIQLILHLRV